MSESKIEKDIKRAIQEEVNKLTMPLYYGICHKCGTEIDRYDSRVTCPFCGAIVDLPFVRQPK